MATILVVDDEPANRELLRIVLTHAGYDVLVASGGAQAIELLVEQRPHLAIVDLYMPGMSGTEVIMTIRRDDRLADTRIALYTGTQEDAAMRDFMEMTQVRHIIPKPGDPQEIMDAVADALR